MESVPEKRSASESANDDGVYQSVILTLQEVSEITGYHTGQAKRQQAWFQARGIPAVINQRNQCVVFRTDLTLKNAQGPRLRLVR